MRRSRPRGLIPTPTPDLLIVFPPYPALAMAHGLGLDGTNEGVRRWVGRYLVAREQRRVALVKAGAAWRTDPARTHLSEARAHHQMVIRFLRRAERAHGGRPIEEEIVS